MSVEAETETGIREISREEAAAFFEMRTRELLGISTDEFFEGVRSGKYRDEESPELVELFMLIPLVQPLPVHARANAS